MANVTAGQVGWIVAHLDEGGKPGKVLGQTAVQPGENKDVKIALSETVPVGGKLWPMLHIDAGTVGTYEFPAADVPVKDASGAVVMKQIAVTAAGQPAQLPNTSGDELPAYALLAVLGLIAGGAALVLARRRI